MIVLDTTVLAYASGGEHPLREPCRRIVRAIGEGSLAATTTVPVIQEFVHVRARRRGSEDAVSAAREAVGYLSPLLPTLEDEVERALELYSAVPELGAFDAFLAAAALAHGARALVSADSSFAGVPGLRHVDPATPELDALIGAA